MQLIFLLFLFWVKRSPVLQSQTNIPPSLLQTLTKYLESGEKTTWSIAYLWPLKHTLTAGSAIPIYFKL